MKYIGQSHILSQLEFYLPEMYENGAKFNFLLSAASGQGKTYLAEKICEFLVGKYYQKSIGRIDNFDPNLVVHFIDEAHIINKFEPLYPLMDSGEYIFIFASNEYTTLPEPIINRCVGSGFVFTPYSNGELRLIAEMHSNAEWSEGQLDYIIKSGGHNPRIIKGLISSLDVYLKYNKKPTRTSELKEVIKDVFGIVDGINPIAANYLEALNNLGGRASLSVLSGILRIDSRTLQSIVEPILLTNRLIKITSRGRILNDKELNI